MSYKSWQGTAQYQDYLACTVEPLLKDSPN